MEQHKSKNINNDLTILFYPKTNSYVVNGCNKLATDIVIPNSYDDNEHGVKQVDHIASKAFMDCKFLKSIIIANTIKTIGKDAFVRCYGLGEVNIPASVVRIADNAFRRCMNIKKITLPLSILEIEPDAFKDSSQIARRAYKNWVKNYAMRTFCLDK